MNSVQVGFFLQHRLKKSTPSNTVICTCYWNKLKENRMKRFSSWYLEMAQMFSSGEGCTAALLHVLPLVLFQHRWQWWWCWSLLTNYDALNFSTISEDCHTIRRSDPQLDSGTPPFHGFDGALTCRGQELFIVLGLWVSRSKCLHLNLPSVKKYQNMRRKDWQEPWNFSVQVLYQFLASLKVNN